MGRADFAAVEDVVDNALLSFEEAEGLVQTKKKPFAGEESFEFEELELDSYSPEDLKLDEYAF